MDIDKDQKGTPILRYMNADYLDVGTTGTLDIRLMNVFESIDESPNAQTVEKHYTGDKAATVLTTGYKPQFAITGDQYKDNAVSEYIRDIGEEQKVGVETDFYRVRLYQPIPDKANTYYARKIHVSVEVSSITGAGGEIVAQEGNLNQIGDLTIGEFNTATRTFTPASEVAPAPASLKTTAAK